MTQCLNTDIDHNAPDPRQSQSAFVAHYKITIISKAMVHTNTDIAGIFARFDKWVSTNGTNVYLYHHQTKV
jgi:hypothetical protein